MDDVEEIKKLKARYFRGLDTKDWDLYSSVFAEDVVVEAAAAVRTNISASIVHGWFLCRLLGLQSSGEAQGSRISGLMARDAPAVSPAS